MSSEITIVAPKTIEESEKLSTTLAKSALLPEALRGKQSDILVTLLSGAELGLAPMQALRGIVVIKGKPALSADLMGALVKRNPVCEYLQLVESTATKATYKTKRKGDPEPTTMSFTMEDAKAAGIAGDMYRKYPANMLRARCLAIICRAVYPDLCLGLYDSDSGELTDGVPTTWQQQPPEREVNAAPLSPYQPKTEAVKERIKAKMQVVDVAPGETEAEAAAKVDESAEAMSRISAMTKEYGFSGERMASIIKGATGKKDRKQVTLDDVEKVRAAIEQMIDAEVAKRDADAMTEAAAPL